MFCNLTTVHFHCSILTVVTKLRAPGAEHEFTRLDIQLFPVKMKPPGEIDHQRRRVYNSLAATPSAACFLDY